jgi:hypothetical protein
VAIGVGTGRSRTSSQKAAARMTGMKKAPVVVGPRAEFDRKGYTPSLRRSGRECCHPAATHRISREAVRLRGASGMNAGLAICFANASSVAHQAACRDIIVWLYSSSTIWWRSTIYSLATPLHAGSIPPHISSSHSITSSARASRVGGTSRPRALAVVKFTTRSNLVGCSTGRLPGFAPRRILSTSSAARRNRFWMFEP